MTRRLISSAALAASILASSMARADDTSDLEGLLDESVLTTASKSSETATTAPATSTTITAEDIRNYGIHSIDEAINFLSLGMFATNPLHDADVGARGVLLSGDWRDHVLFLVNGHSMNERLRGAAYLDHGAGVPIEMVDHIEVILGPGAVLYGSNAMLGVINVVTKRAKDMKGVNVVAESELGKSWKVGAGVGYEFSLFKVPSELTLQLEYYKQDGPIFHFGPQNTGDDPFFGQKENYGANSIGPGIWGGEARSSYYSRVPAGILQLRIGDLEINVMASAYRRGAPYTSQYWSSNVDFDDHDSYYQDHAYRGDIRYKATLSPIVSVTSRLYGDATDSTTHSHNSLASGCLYPNGGATCLYDTPSAARWAGWENQLSLDWLRDARFVTLLGADARLNFTGTKSDVQNATTLQYLDSSTSVTRHTDEQLGAYLQQTWDPTARVGLNAGARVDASSASRAAFSPRIAGRVEAWKNGTLKLIYAEAFRSPAVVETEYTNALVYPNPGIRPETVRSVEGILEQRFGSQRILFGAFRSWWNDVIAVHILTPTEQQQLQQQTDISLRGVGIAQLRNLSRIDNFGFNAAYEGSLAETRLRYGLNVTGAIARQTDDAGATNPLTVSPNLYGNARVSYALPKGWPTVALAANATGKMLADRALDGHFAPLPYSPVQLTLRGTLSGDVPGVKGLSYRASVNWAVADRMPYVVGPYQVYDPKNPMPAELAPVDTFRATIGLSYRWGN